ncbi:MAG: endonuclease/exonuclease/phosphatase family protein [Saprospiraceae bacterium]|nr:endonuclease/exonuclease/phosphatase family protein [Saprospiraceae bacterium]
MQQFYSFKTNFLYLFIIFSIATKAEITFISWNIKDFGKSRNDEEIKAIAKHIRHADILAIQEVVAKDPGGAQAVARLADQLNRMGAKWDYSVSDPTQSTSTHKSERYAYIWKTSKLTITGGGPRLLTELSGYAEREPYFIQFKSNNKVLTIINYHACTHKDDYPERAEINAISKWLIDKSYDNLIWAGDMNLEIDDIAFSPILKNSFRNVLNGKKTSLKKSCKNGNYLSRSEDNILYKIKDFKLKSAKVLDFIHGGPCDEVEWKWISYSNHLAVVVIFHLI